MSRVEDACHVCHVCRQAKTKTIVTYPGTQAMSYRIHCDGEFFRIEDQLWYRCWLDGTCISTELMLNSESISNGNKWIGISPDHRFDKCPHCTRDVAAESLAAETRDAVTRTEPRTIVSYPGSDVEFELKKQK